MASSHDILAIVKPGIFRSYIDASKPDDNLKGYPGEIINPNIKQFHFIVAFAADQGNTGKFFKKWNVVHYDGNKINDVKKNHPRVDVKVVISFGGRGDEYSFNPVEKEKWIDNAKDSLKEIIIDLRDKWGNIVVDGIDINYDTIKSSKEVFSRCIGELIKFAKEGCWAHVVSIAPSKDTQSHYNELYTNHGGYIDWVNYKFYTHTIPSQDVFEKLYRDLSSNVYAPHKLLAGFSTDSKDAGKFTQDDFFGGSKVLASQQLLPGIFVWDANDSAPNHFYVEKKAQKILTHSDDN